MPEQKTIWSFCGSNGGSKRSFVAAEVARAIALKGERVLLVDAGNQGPGLHDYFGMDVQSKSFDWPLKADLNGLSEAACQTGVDGLRLIWAGEGFLSLADMAFSGRREFLSAISLLDADHIIVDMAGSCARGLDLFTLSDKRVIILFPEPQSVKGAFDALRCLVYRRLDAVFSDNFAISALISAATDAKGASPVKTFSDLCARMALTDRAGAERAMSEIRRFAASVVIDRASSHDDTKAFDALCSAAKTFLSLETELAGIICQETKAAPDGTGRRPAMIEGLEGAGKDIEDIVLTLIGGRKGARASSPEVPSGPEKVQEVFGFNDNVYHNDAVMHVQTEVAGGDDPCIETIVYHGGRIFFSKKTFWSSLGPEAASAGIKDAATRQHRAAIAAIKLDKISIKG